MRLRYMVAAAATLGVGGLVGWRLGSTRIACETSCPPSSRCVPSGCGPDGFNWGAAIVCGLIVAMLLGAVAAVVLLRSDDS